MINRNQLKHLVLGLSLALSACGGGGGAPQDVTYSGATNQATVTNTNAKALSADAYEGGQLGASMGPVGVVTVSSASQPDTARLQQLCAILTTTAEQVAATATAAAPPTLAGITNENDVPGPYGGSYHYAVSLDQATGAVAGTVTYNGYKSSATSSVSGSMSFTGVYNQVTRSYTTFSLTVRSMTFTSSGKSASICGTLSLTRSGSTENLAMSMVLADGTTGRTYWVKDFTYTTTGTTMTLTGTYYDPTHGYVTITTLTPLTVTKSSATPTAGQLLVTGANGTKARLTFTATGHTVEVDANGTNTFTVVP